MSHYFISDDSVASNIKIISFEVLGTKVQLFTDNGVFSKNRIDEGTLAFLKVLVPLHLTGEILDLGCGYGPIGLTIAITSSSASVMLADVNTRALALCNKNAHDLGLGQRVTVLQSDVYENIEDLFDNIVINPPIRAGKKVTYAMYEGALKHLVEGGSLFIVIRKAQGGPSASKYIESLFGNIKLLKRDSGYYIYQAIKSEQQNIK